MSKHSHGHGNTVPFETKGGAGGTHPPGDAGKGGGNSGTTPGKNPSENLTENSPAGHSPKNAENNQADTRAGAQTDAQAKNPDDKSPEAKIAALESELAAQTQKSADLEAKLADLNDQYLRKAADFENFRKRMNREKQEITEFANQNLLLDLLPVIDDFERAIKSAETSKDFASFYNGVTMIEKGLSTQLENKWGLKHFDSVGELFDPNRHEALQMEKSADVAEATVKEDYLKGYLLKDRVIRCAKVKVLMPENEGSAGSGK